MAIFKPLPIIREIYSGKKYQLTYYMPPVDSAELNTSYLVHSYGCLYLKMPYISNISKEALKLRAFKITHLNLKSLLRTLENVIDWFGNEAYKDMYLRDEDGNLVFNLDFSKLYEITNKGYFEDQMIKITPAIISYSNGSYEGVNLFVNILDNKIELTVDEVVKLYDVLSEFNFTNESILSIEILRQSINIGTFKNKDQYYSTMNRFSNF